MHPENPFDRTFFRPQLSLYDPRTRTNSYSSKILVRYAENEHFPPPFLRSLLSAASCVIAIGHGRGKGLGSRSNFALPRVAQSVSHLTLSPRLFRGRDRSQYHKMPQKEAIVEKAVENAHFQRNARGLLKKRNLCGC